jgi:hypothetical protein
MHGFAHVLTPSEIMSPFDCQSGVPAASNRCAKSVGTPVASSVQAMIDPARPLGRIPVPIFLLVEFVKRIPPDAQSLLPKESIL